MAEKHKEVDRRTRPVLEIVLKCDSVGSLEAVSGAISRMSPEVSVGIVHSGIGGISSSDVLFAETASRLIVGFQVDVLPGTDRTVRERGVEVRLYNVIYEVTSDLKAVVESMAPRMPQEQITAAAEIIAVFKSTRRGVIIGCEVRDGSLSIGDRFRVISAMGPVYSGTIESLHIGDNAVQKASRGQKAGIKIREFDRARVGDIVECYRPIAQKSRPWEPRGQIIRK